VLRREDRWPESWEAWDKSLGKGPARADDWVCLGLRTWPRGEQSSVENGMGLGSRMSV
jgi:hypothetical protein